MKNVIFNLFFNVGRGGVNSNHCGVVSLKVVGSMPKRKLGRTNASSAPSLYILHSCCLLEYFKETLWNGNHCLFVCLFCE